MLGSNDFRCYYNLWFPASRVLFSLVQCPPIRNGVTSGQAFSLRADLMIETRHRPVRGSEKGKSYKLQANFLKILPGISYGIIIFTKFQLSVVIIIIYHVVLINTILIL